VRQIKRVLVVGAGTMGAQIAFACARADFAVACQDVSPEALKIAEVALHERSRRDVAKGRLKRQSDRTAFRALTFGTDLEELSGGADVVIEAVAEKLEVKRKLFARLDELVPPGALLTSNSSSFLPSQMASAVARPEQFCNVHFFNPVSVMRCVEIIRGPETADETIRQAVEFATRLGKTPVVLEREIPGFVANRILNAVRDQAVFLYESGIADFESIDLACRMALGYPMGPFELMDFTGIDIGYYVKLARYKDTGDPADAPSLSVSALVERGDLGKKTGCGWYRYDGEGRRVGRSEFLERPGLTGDPPA
jgi:3-hydroxybutyryl-CoA dehydrogenase